MKLENAIDSMRTSSEPVPVVLVGGGAILVDKWSKKLSTVKNYNNNCTIKHAWKEHEKLQR